AHLWVFTTTDKKPAAAFLKRVQETFNMEKADGHELFLSKNELKAGIFRAGERTFVIGPEKVVRQVLKAGAAKQASGPLAPALRLAQEQHQIVVGLGGNHAVVAVWRRLLLDPGPGLARLLRPLTEATGSALAIRYGKETALTGRFEFADAKAATA